jgi:hypothetical protein
VDLKVRRLPVPKKLVLSFFGKGIDERCGLVEELDQVGVQVVVVVVDLVEMRGRTVGRKDSSEVPLNPLP